MTHILFVDDEPEILSGLRRALRARRDLWTMHFASSSTEALAVLDEVDVDVVVTDMLMPGVDGASLLAEVRERRPGAVRIVLSGHADPTNAVRSIPVAHQFLAKPCDPTVLAAAIERSLLLRDRLSGRELRDFVGGLESLPSPSATIVALQSVLAVHPIDSERVAELVVHDVAISTKLLQIANSAFFGLPRTMCDPVEALNYLGPQALCELVMSAEVFRSLSGRGSERDAEVERVQMVGIERAEIASELARRAARPAAAERQVWVAAFLADVGSLLLLSADRPSAFGMRDGTDDERLLFAMVPTIGAYLISMWGLPHHLVEAVGLSDDPPQMHGCESAGFTWLGRKVMEGTAREVADDQLEVLGLSRALFDQTIADWEPLTLTMNADGS